MCTLEVFLITGLFCLSILLQPRLQAHYVAKDSRGLCGHMTGLTWAQDPFNVSRTLLCLDGRIMSLLSCGDYPVLLDQLKKCLRRQISINVSLGLHSARLLDILRVLESDTDILRDLNPTDQIQRHTLKANSLNYLLEGSNTVPRTSMSDKLNVQRLLSKLSPFDKDITIKENSLLQSTQNVTVASLAELINIEENKKNPRQVTGSWPENVQLDVGNREMHHLTQSSWLDSGGEMRTLTQLQAVHNHARDDVSTTHSALLLRIKEYFPGHLCANATVSFLLAHPTYCHWFYNCSLPPDDAKWAAGVEPLTSECPYPLLFSEVSLTCMAYNEVNCGKRTEYKAPCDYRENNCTLPTCHRCQTLFANCAELPDGLHPFPGREWTPWFINCRDERTMMQGRCDTVSPIFSPLFKQCVSMDQVPTSQGGTQTECRGRADGYHPDESGICHMFFECRSEHLFGIAACSDDVTFDPVKQQCSPSAVVPPCGPLQSLKSSDVFCAGQTDGFYADLYGRCQLYFDCKRLRLRAFLKCPTGTFNPIKQTCETGMDAYAPCGLRPNPCKGQFDGLYTDTLSNCLSTITCRNGYVSKVEQCPDGLVFDSSTSKCTLPELAAPPCGIAPTCSGKQDGKHPNEAKGCAHYYLCSNGSHVGFGHCDVTEGGFFFNPVTRECDFPPNICPPCGHRKDLYC